MKDIERFNLPMPPQGLAFPEPAQLYITTAAWVLVALFAAAYLVQAYRSKSALPILLLVGGAICYFAEPMVDVLALCWHPRTNQWVALHTYGPVPLWGLGVYTIFFGAATYLMLMAARRGIKPRQFWIGVLVFFAADLVCELPIIHAGLYSYYGDPPYKFMGLPLYWLFINILGPLICVALLLRAPRFFSGWRRVLIPLLPMTTDIAGSLAAGWPIMSALNAPVRSAELKWAAATLTIVLALAIMDGLSRLICDERADAPALDAEAA